MQVASAIQELADGPPIMLFGHSMGAVVALETARELEASGIELAFLWASGSREAPLPPSSDGDEESDDEVIARLLELGGTDAEMAADPVFRELILPYVRGDARMFHSYRMAGAPRLNCPIGAIVGDQDENADRRPWSQLTTSAFLETIVPGGHFYLTTSPPVGLLKNSYCSTLSPATPDH
jgi:surfactin synthase thioesterase subunit